MISVEKIVNKINKKYNINKVDFAIVIGSGLMEAAVDLTDTVTIPYDKLGMPKSKVKGHSGKFVFGKFGDRMGVLVSRLHFYESGDMSKVRLPFEIIAKLGCKDIVLLTSSGGVNTSFAVGDIMVINDHINLSGYNPLVGINPIVFVPMAHAYDIEVIKRLKEIAKEEKIDIKEGVHFQFAGPSYETLSEIYVARKLGADSISMSTSYDCIISKYLQMRVCGIAVIVNTFEENDSMNKLNHEEVLENASKACKRIKILLTKLLQE